LEKKINKKYKVLVVDNDPEILNYIIKIFEIYSDLYSAIFALNGKDALEIAQNHQPDIIISDWKMPEISGIELIAELKKNNSTKDIPIILITGIMTSVENLKMAFDIGAIDYIRKPFDQIELLARLRLSLSLSETFKEIKHHKISLEKNEQRVKILADAAFEGIIIHDKINIVEVNQKILNMTGFEREDLVGSSIFEITSPDFFNTVISNLEGDEEKCYKIKCKRKDKTEFDVEIWSKPIVYKGINLRVAAIRDITAQIEQLEQLNYQVEVNLKKEKKEALNLNSMLEVKKKELIANSLILVQEYEKNKKMITELETFSEDCDINTQQKLKSIINKYKITFESWKEFYIRFVETNKDFYLKLKQKFPDLTKSELKLCALLKLDLTSSEIAALSYQSQNSIYVARSRLRKKMNMHKVDDFTVFFESLETANHFSIKS